MAALVALSGFRELALHTPQVQFGYFNTESGTPEKFSYGGSAECLIVADAEEARSPGLVPPALP